MSKDKSNKIIINKLNSDLSDFSQKKFDINLNVPLLLEAKLGDNWLDMKEVV